MTKIVIDMRQSIMAVCMEMTVHDSQHMEYVFNDYHCSLFIQPTVMQGRIGMVLCKGACMSVKNRITWKQPLGYYAKK